MASPNPSSLRERETNLLPCLPLLRSRMEHKPIDSSNALSPNPLENGPSRNAPAAVNAVATNTNNATPSTNAAIPAPRTLPVPLPTNAGQANVKGTSNSNGSSIPLSHPAPSFSIATKLPKPAGESRPSNSAHSQNSTSWTVPNPMMAVPNPLQGTAPSTGQSNVRSVQLNPTPQSLQAAPVSASASIPPSSVAPPHQQQRAVAPTQRSVQNPMQHTMPRPVVQQHHHHQMKRPAQTAAVQNPVLQTHHRPLVPLQPAPQPIQLAPQRIQPAPQPIQPAPQPIQPAPQPVRHVAPQQPVRQVQQVRQQQPGYTVVHNNQPNGSGQSRRPRVVLSPEAKQALARAIWSAIRSPTGEISSELMSAALTTGLPRSAILNAARVAREREAMKRKSMQQQQRHHQQQHHQQQQQQQQPQYQMQKQQQHPHHQQQQAQQHSQQRTYASSMAPPHAGYRDARGAVPPTRAPSAAASPKVMKPVSAVLPRGPVPNMQYASKPPPKPMAKPVPRPKVVKESQQALAAKLALIKTEERVKWKRLQHGVFLTQKGKYTVLAHTVCGISRSSSLQSRLPVAKSNHVRKQLGAVEVADLVRLQQKLRSTKEAAVCTLYDPERFKRSKIEPKKFAKALDRVVRKARQNTADALNKQHKELSKMIMSHQSEFFKFHKQRRADASRLARTIRDNFDKESKKKEKDAVAAEKARLAALKANDMDAYSKLLEETKNDRLKFLMDKTEKHFSQISTSLLQERNQDGSVSSSGGAASYYASAHLKTEEVRQPSILVGGDLKEYQMSGLQWLVSLYNNKLNGILADEMGLGKTIQAIALIAYLMELKQNLGPYLVIVPLSTLSNWTNEFQKWCPSAHVICYKGTPGQRKEIYKEQVQNGHFNVLLTTYEYIIKDKASLRKIEWQYAIVDEGHRMKNAASKFAKTLSSQYTTKYRVLLTGTPLMNELGELWSLLNFLLPTIFNSVDTFDQWFNQPFASFGSMGNDDEANFLTNEERMFIIHRLHELLRPFMLRRVKSEVLDQLPEKVEKILRCELSSWQKELYQQISRKAAVENDSFVNPQPASRGLNNVVMQLRKVCNHPYLFCAEGYQIHQDMIRSSGKFELLDRMLPKLKAAGHRVLMFTQMTAVMTILEDYFLYRGYLSLRLDGSTPAEEREKRMYKFNAPDSPYFIFLLSTRAGGLGLNLTSANTVIIFDSDWNPMMDLQAQDRAHRIGQRSDVSVFRLITNSPVEEKILSRATEKLNMSELVVEAGQFDKRSVEKDNSLERKKLMEVLLTDFSSNPAASKAATDVTEDNLASEMTGSDDENDDDDGGEDDEDDELNELLSNNENDYQLYKAIDRERANDIGAVDTSLFTSDENVPEWIKNPPKRKGKAAQNALIPGDGPRKRKEVVYDDGLTEKQFLRLMDKQFDDAAAEKQSGKVSRRGGASKADMEPKSEAEAKPVPGSELTDWTFRKLISCSKSVVALKDPSTKRRLSEVFLEKPSPEQYPDYYEKIEKPIAINDILRKCRAKLYVNLQEFREDWKTMFSNAKQFNGAESWVVKDGNALERELNRVLKKNGFSDDTPPKLKPVASKQSTPKQTSPKLGRPPKSASPKLGRPPKSASPKQASSKEDGPPKKKLRIKLSLKTLKKKPSDIAPGQAEQPVAAIPEPPVPVSQSIAPPAGRGRGKRGRKPKKLS